LEQVFADELRKGERARRPVRSPKPLKRPLERLAGVHLRRKAATLDPPRAADADTIAIRPELPPFRTVRLHSQDLTLLHHDDRASQLAKLARDV
jgi:hypothetical protein